MHHEIIARLNDLAFSIAALARLAGPVQNSYQGEQARLIERSIKAELTEIVDDVRELLGDKHDPASLPK